MKTRTKIITSIIALVLSAVMLFVAVAVNNNTGKMVIADTPTRTVALAQSSIDAQSILDEFDDATLKTEGTTTYFEGFKPLDLNAVSELDSISEVDYETLSKCTVKYNFSYDYESNIATLSADMKNEQGEIEVETISGYAFINQTGEIDALMDVDGEFILISEMQDAGLIQNCGWFSNLFKKIVVAVVTVVVVAAVAATIVATAGAGMAAVVGVSAAAGAVVGGVAGGIISYSEYGKLDWRWIVGGAVIGGALGAVTGWGVGTLMGAGSTSTQVSSLIKAADKGKLGVTNTIKNKGYLNPQSKNYRKYYEYYNTISKEIMKAKTPVVEPETKFLKWVVEGAYNSTCGRWELVINPVKKVITHFVFVT